MTRTDRGTWDVASRAGATATWVITARALADKRAGALIDDPLRRSCSPGRRPRSERRTVSADLRDALANGPAPQGF